MADIEILAEKTQQVTVGKKNGSRSMPPHKGRLFAKMWHTARNNCKFTGIAVAGFSRKTVCITPAWTEIT